GADRRAHGLDHDETHQPCEDDEEAVSETPPRDLDVHLLPPGWSWNARGETTHATGGPARRLSTSTVAADGSRPAAGVERDARGGLARARSARSPGAGRSRRPGLVD